MAIIQDVELFKDIKQDKIKNQYLLFGSEIHFVSKAAESIIKKAVPAGFESFNLQRFNGDKVTINDIETAVDALPMMSDKKCVVVKDWDIDKLSKTDFEGLCELVKNPNPSTVLVIYITSFQVDSKKSAKIKKIIDIISKNGEVCEFKYKDKLTLKKAIVALAEKRKVEITSQVCDYLIEKSGTSYSVLLNEINKLINYVGQGNSITKVDVDLLCIASIDSSAFDLAKSIMQNNFKRAFNIIDELFTQRQEAVAVLSALNMTFSDLYRAKCAVIAQKTAADVVTDFGYKKNREFAVKNAFRDVSQYSIEHLRYCIDAIAQADKMLKSSKMDDRVILEQMLGKMYMMAVKQRVI